MARIGAALLALGLAAAGVAFVLGAAAWGCPSQAELARSRWADEGVDTFAARRLPLVPVASPLARDRAYAGAVAYRHATARATLTLVVCRARCLQPLRRLPARVASQHVRMFSSLGNNLALLVTDVDGYSGQRLLARAAPAVNGLDAAQERGSRCYVG